MSAFPDDEDGMVLKMLTDKGVDLSTPREVEFYCYTKNKEYAEEILLFLSGKGFRPHIYKSSDQSDPLKIYSVYAEKKILLSYDNVIAEQNMLNEYLKKYDTFCDGWMTES